MTSRIPDIRFKCWDCPYKTLMEGGARDHSLNRKHFVSDAPKPSEEND